MTDTTEKMDVAVLTEESVKNKIYMIRGQKVMLDADLAKIYGYETRYLNQQVKRNIGKFEGEDFMFQLTEQMPVFGGSDESDAADKGVF